MLLYLRIMVMQLAYKIWPSCIKKLTQDSLSEPNKIYYITDGIKGSNDEIVVGDNSTLIFIGNGKLSSLALQGNNLKVINKTDKAIFDNCTFTDAIFVDSEVSAEDFGWVGDMSSEPYTYTFKEITYDTNKRKGTNNKVSPISQFLTGSRGIKMNFEKEYFSELSEGQITIGLASDLELCGGGAMTTGFKITDCKNVNAHDLSFYGYHTIHDFPPVWYSTSEFPLSLNGTTYTKDNTFNLSADGYAISGIAYPAFSVQPSKVDDYVDNNTGFTYKNIYAEMRQSGIDSGIYASGKKNIYCVSNVRIEDCNFDHIYYQPIGFHVDTAYAKNVRGNYCLQSVDISTGSHNVTIDDCHFTNTAIGPKQESPSGFFDRSYNNKIMNCTFEINESFIILGASQFIMSIAEGKDSDVFKVQNCVFNIDKNRTSPGFMTRSYGVDLDNVTFNISINAQNSKGNYDMLQLFSIYGASSHSPIINLNDVTVNLQNGTRLYYLAVPQSDADFTVNANKLSLIGDGSVVKYFDGVENLTTDELSLEIRDTLGTILS